MVDSILGLMSELVDLSDRYILDVFIICIVLTLF